MPWIILIIAGFFETGFAFCMGQARQSSGIESILWWAGFAVCLIASMALLYKASQDIPIGTAYAIWTGIGAAGIVILGIFVFNEPHSFWRLFFIATLVISIIGLRVVSSID